MFGGIAFKRVTRHTSNLVRQPASHPSIELASQTVIADLASIKLSITTPRYATSKFQLAPILSLFSLPPPPAAGGRIYHLDY